MKGITKLGDELHVIPSLEFVRDDGTLPLTIENQGTMYAEIEEGLSVAKITDLPEDNAAWGGGCTAALSCVSRSCESTQGTPVVHSLTTGAKSPSETGPLVKPKCLVTTQVVSSSLPTGCMLKN